MAWITTGTISVAAGSTVVSGTGTAWLTHLVQPGWALQAGGVQSEIANVISDTELRLTRPYAGSAIANGEYQIIQIAAVAQPLVNAVRDQIGQVQQHLDGALAGLFPSGSASEPGIAFQDNPSTGWRLNSDGDLVLTIGGVDAAVWHLDRNMALGASEARTRLHVQKDVEFDPANSVETSTAFLRGGVAASEGAFGGALALSKPNSTRPGVVLVAKQTSADNDAVGLSFFTHQSVNSNEVTQEVVTITHDGHVGIGLSSPDEIFHIASVSPVLAHIERYGPGNAGIKLSNDNYQLFFGLDTSGNFVVSSSTNLGADPDLSVNPTSGNVGIGTSNPAAKLHVVDGGAANNTPELTLESLRPTMLLKDASEDATSWQIRTAQDTGSRLEFRYGDASINALLENLSLALRDDGRVGIGISTPATPLHVYQGGTGSTRLRLGNAEGYADFMTDAGRARIVADGGGGALDFYDRGRLEITTDTATTGPALSAFVENSSYTATASLVEVRRPASSGYNFLRCVSGSGDNNDNEFRLRGDGNAFAAGSWQSGGADYAEYFEWEDGNLGGEDRRGVSVVLVGDKIRQAEDGDIPIGVISASPSLVGDADIDRWMYKYLRDDFGAEIMEDCEIVSWDETDPETGKIEHHQFAADALPADVVVPPDAETTVIKRPVLNPAWDAEQEYVPRSERTEWAYVGMLGKLRVRKGQPVAPSWIKMKDVSETVEMWLVK